MGDVIAENDKLKCRIENLCSTVKRYSELTLKQIAEMKSVETTREDARVFYDHYRIKMHKLEKSHAGTTDSRKQEKFQRNVQKFEEAKHKFEEENNKLESLMEQIQQKMEVVLN